MIIRTSSRALVSCLARWFHKALRFDTQCGATRLAVCVPRPWLLGLAPCVLAGMGAAGAAGAAAPARPNILFVLVDDLGYGDLGVFFQNLRRTQDNPAEPWHLTPHLDTLAAEGVRLPHHYCPAPVCAPSRASLLLGVHQGHANVRDNQFDKELEDNHTLATVLRGAGYATAAIGKWGLQGGGSGPDWPAHPLSRGFDYYYGYIRHVDGHEHYPKEGLYRGRKEVWENRTEVSAGLDKCYTADLWAARAKQWIVDHQATQPFFMYLAFDTPHAVLELPTQAHPPGGGLTGGLQWLGTPGHMINTASGTIDSYLHPDYASATYDADRDPATPEVAWPDVYRRYATDVRRLDDCMGDLVQLLKDLAIDDRTLIVFTTDNGPSQESYLAEPYHPDFFNSFGPFDGIKRDVWEGGIRVGALARWPGGIPADRVSSVPCGAWDWMPTFAELAGVPAPARSDGRSLVPSLTGVGAQMPPTVYLEYYQNGTTPSYSDFAPAHRGRRRNQMQMVRMGDVVGLRYNVGSHADNFEIYDIVNDPQQLTNLVRTAAYGGFSQQLKDRVLQLRRPNASAPRPYDAEPVPAVAASPVTPGVEWRAFTGTHPWVPELTTMTPASSGIADQPGLDVRPRDNDFGLLFTGYLSVPAEGDYTFSLTADTGALLRIHEATVIDADFGHEPDSEVSGSIKLKAGLHPFRLYYARGSTGVPSLGFAWSGPGFAKEPVPGSAFRRDGTPPPGPPEARDDSAATVQDEPMDIEVLASDEDDGTPEALSIINVTTPAGGTAGIVEGGIRYTPNAGFLGKDAFSYVIGTQDLRDGHWHHVACTFLDDRTPDVTDVRLYVDGAPEPISTSQSQTVDTDGTSVPVTIGVDSQNRHFNGVIDEVRIYRRALSPTEIAELACLAQASPDLQDWDIPTTSEVIAPPSAATEGFEEISVHATLPAGQHSRLFLRLQVGLP